jgi:putative FmdB family regulatory protein
MMPLYEYRCSECNFEIEMLQSMGASAPKCCKCSTDKLMKKLISTTSFTLKGSGWAKDNYGLKQS